MQEKGFQAYQRNQLITEITVRNCFRKAGVSEKATEEVLDENGDSFKDFTAEGDMELDETIDEFRTRLPEEAPLQSNAATILEIGEEIATSGDKPTNADILVFIREEFTSVEEEENDIEGKEEPLECPTSFRVDKAVKTL